MADGLHLIDFEQLKIENQTLNEKIEERNEELQKLRSKIVRHVVQVSHTRERLRFVVKQNEKNKLKVKELEDELKSLKHKQTQLKNAKEHEMKINQ